MKVILAKVIEFCDICPEAIYDGGHICRVTRRTISFGIIPSWCPLKDAGSWVDKPDIMFKICGKHKREIKSLELIIGLRIYPGGIVLGYQTESGFKETECCQHCKYGVR